MKKGRLFTGILVIALVLILIVLINTGMLGDILAKITGKSVTYSTAIYSVCDDSDGGDMQFIKGTAVHTYKNNTKTYDDYCDLQGRYLIEYFCVGNATVDSKQYTCEKGCKDGACASIDSTANAVEPNNSRNNPASQTPEAPETTPDTAPTVTSAETPKLSLWQKFLNLFK